MDSGSAGSTQASNKSFCQNRNMENGFVSELKNQFDVFFHSSMEDHKTCFKTKFHNAYDKVKQLGKLRMFERSLPSQDGTPISTLNHFYSQTQDPFS